MKKALISILLSTISHIGIAQNNSLDSKPQQEPVYTMVEQIPTFVGGESALLNYLNEKVKYPKEAKKAGQEAKARFRFIINQDGSISDIESMRPLGYGFEEEGIRVIKSMPKWIPGKNNGRAVRVYYTLPINFKLKN